MNANNDQIVQDWVDRQVSELSSQESNVVSVKGASFVKDQARLLDGIDLRVKAGEIMALVGPNGAGKTTLLNALTHEISLTRGTVEFAGKNITQVDLQTRARHMAVLPQLSLLNFPYTVEQVVSLGRIPHATGAAIDDGIVHEAMQLMDIVYLRDRLYTALSGGEKQRCQLARVFAQIWREVDASPRLLLLDEPTSALDLGHQQQLMTAVKRMAGQGVAVIMVVHDVNLALAYADSLLALLCGRTLAYGEVEAVVSEELLHTMFQADVRLVQHPQKNHKVIVV